MFYCGYKSNQYPPISDLFFDTYPEFVGYVSADRVEDTAKRALTLYPVLHSAHCLNYKLATCMCVAHLLIRGGLVLGTSDTSNMGGGSGGIVTGASVDNVSVHFQNKPISNLAEDYFATTSYGQEFLAWLSSLSGVDYLN